MKKTQVLSLSWPPKFHKIISELTFVLSLLTIWSVFELSISIRIISTKDKYSIKWISCIKSYLIGPYLNGHYLNDGGPQVLAFILMSVQMKSVRLRSVQCKVRYDIFQTYSTVNSDLGYVNFFKFQSIVISIIRFGLNYIIELMKNE